MEAGIILVVIGVFAAIILSTICSSDISRLNTATLACPFLFNEATLYARLLAARWAELNDTEDPFRSLPV